MLDEEEIIRFLYGLDKRICDDLQHLGGLRLRTLSCNDHNSDERCF